MAQAVVLAHSLLTTDVNSSNTISGLSSKMHLARSTRIFSPLDSTAYGFSHDGGEENPTAVKAFSMSFTLAFGISSITASAVYSYAQK